MDLGNPGSLVSGLLIGLLGMAMFAYGKKQGSPRCLVTGLALCVFPYFVTSLVLMWVITGACFGGLYVASRLEG